MNKGPTVFDISNRDNDEVIKVAINTVDGAIYVEKDVNNDQLTEWIEYLNYQEMIYLPNAKVLIPYHNVAAIEVLDNE